MGWGQHTQRAKIKVKSTNLAQMNFLFMFFTHLKFFIIMPSFVVQFSILILLRLGSVSVSSFRSHSARFFPSHPHPHPHSHSRRGFSFGSPTSFLCMRIGEICVRVLNKNLLHILLYLRLPPCLCLVALFGQMEKNRRARHKASTASCWLPPPAGGG